MYFKRLFVNVPVNKLKFTFIKSQGPGGQNVNKTNSKAQLTADLSGGWLSAEMIRSIKKFKNGATISSDSGRLVIQSDSHRSQLQNKQACNEKLRAILNDIENDCKPAGEASGEQVKRVEGFKEAFKMENRMEKVKRKDKKTWRCLKNRNNWKSNSDDI